MEISRSPVHNSHQAPDGAPLCKDRQAESSSERTIPMRTRKTVFPLLAVLFFAFCLPIVAVAQTMPNGGAIDAEVSKIMTPTHARGMAVAVIDHGKIGYVHAYGI